MLAYSIERKLDETNCRILHCMCQCLREWYPEWHFATYPWNYKYNTGMHQNCSISDSNFHVLHYIKEFDGVMLRKIPTWQTFPLGWNWYTSIQLVIDLLPSGFDCIHKDADGIRNSHLKRKRGRLPKLHVWWHPGVDFSLQ